MPSTSVVHTAAIGILITYIILAVLFALRTPSWQAPDEPAHYNYIAQVAAGDVLPVIRMGDWDNDYLETLKAARFAPALLDDLHTIRYENHQPPLYYWLAAPVYLITDGSLIALRLYSALLGILTVILTFLIGRAVFPARPQIALAAMALVAFLPQHIAITASVNNDALAWAIIALTLLALVRYLRRAGVTAWQVGLLVGVAFITKTTAYFLAGVVLVAIVLHRWPERWRGLLADVAAFTLPASIFAIFWWGRNIIVYGFPDFLGLGAHDAIVTGQLRTGDLIDAVGIEAYLQRGLTDTFNSFWGQFGWMGVPMPAEVYAIIAGLLLITGAGLLAAMTHREASASTLKAAEARHIAIIMALILVLAAAAFLYYNTEFVQFQGRYLFTGLVPFALLMALGIDGWRARLAPRWWWITPLPFCMFALLAAWLIWRVIPGALAP